MNKKTINQVLKIDASQLNAYSSGLLQGKAYRTLQFHLTKVLFQFELSIPEWKLLGQLYDHGSLRLADLAQRLDVEPPLVTSLVDSLEKKNVVVRKPDEYDKRAKIISCTSKGRLLIQKIEPEVKKAMNSLLKGIDRTELISYIRVLTAIVDNGQTS